MAAAAAVGEVELLALAGYEDFHSVLRAWAAARSPLSVSSRSGCRHKKRTPRVDGWALRLGSAVILAQGSGPSACSTLAGSLILGVGAAAMAGGFPTGVVGSVSQNSGGRAPLLPKVQSPAARDPSSSSFRVAGLVVRPSGAAATRSGCGADRPPTPSCSRRSPRVRLGCDLRLEFELGGQARTINVGTAPRYARCQVVGLSRLATQSP